MFKKVLTSLGFVALALVLVWIPFDVTLAADPPVDDSPFVTCTGTDCSFCNLIQMANIIIVWLFGILFIIFAIIMFSAGWGMITAGGNDVALDTAKKKFQNAIIGIIIIMAAWLLINIFMKGLLVGDNNKAGELKNWGPWSEVECQTQIEAVKWEGDPESDPNAIPHGSLGAPSGPMPTGCTGGTCVPLDSSVCQTVPNRTNCGISPDLADRLKAFHDAAGVNGARVTEGMPPTRPHKSACHNNGTCVDYSKVGGMSADEVVRTINAANANNLRPVYEVKTQADKDALVTAGAPADNIKVLGNWISAPHFSIYGY